MFKFNKPNVASEPKAMSQKIKSIDPIQINPLSLFEFNKPKLAPEMKVTGKNMETRQMAAPVTPGFSPRAGAAQARTTIRSVILI